jgi:predicted nucleic acid-binding protein
MTIFLDSSSLCKLYFIEPDSVEVERLFSDFEIENIVLSELAEVEFPSIIWKKVRTKELTESEAEDVLLLFKEDLRKYEIIDVDRNIIERAKELLNLYGKEGLRTLDSIRLATCNSVKKSIDLFHTSDKLLHSLFLKEGLQTSENHKIGLHKTSIVRTSTRFYVTQADYDELNSNSNAELIIHCVPNKNRHPKGKYVIPNEKARQFIQSKQGTHN